MQPQARPRQHLQTPTELGLSRDQNRTRRIKSRRSRPCESMQCLSPSTQGRFVRRDGMGPSVPLPRLHGQCLSCKELSLLCPPLSTHLPNSPILHPPTYTHLSTYTSIYIYIYHMMCIFSPGVPRRGPAVPPRGSGSPPDQSHFTRDTQHTTQLRQSTRYHCAVRLLAPFCTR